jgi:ERF superfamily
MTKSESIDKIAPALLEAQMKMGNATKDSKNPFYKSSYADLNAIREVVTPALNAVGITVLQPTGVTMNGTPVVQTTLLHSSGQYFTSEFPIVAAKQNDPQAFGSAVSYARRYSLQSFLSVGATDDDGEASMGRAKPSYATKSEAPKAMILEKSTVPDTNGAVKETFAMPAKKVTFSKKAVTTPTADTGDDI